MKRNDLLTDIDADFNLLSQEDLEFISGGDSWFKDVGYNFMNWILYDLPNYQQSAASKSMHAAHS